MSTLKNTLKKIYWKIPISNELKRSIRRRWFEYEIGKEEKKDTAGTFEITKDVEQLSLYSKYVLELYKKRSKYYCEEHKNAQGKQKYSIAAYYLTQFYPNAQNDEWWGKGTTEWNNVNQAMPQFVGHDQPRKPGELGYYDLRLKENMKRQIELAKNYGITEFCFYYYWFNGQRLLEQPLNMFLENDDLDIEFSYCWANENWTKRFSGTDYGALMKLPSTVDCYSRFIDAVLEDMMDRRYHRIDGMPVLSVYRPNSIPKCELVLENWQKKAQKILGVSLYLIAVQESNSTINWVEKGFSAETEFQPRSVEQRCKEITSQKKPIRKDFSGKIYDYKDLVENRRYIAISKKHCYHAIMPMWDNTARRNARGTIFHGSTPELYKQWLCDLLELIDDDQTIDEKRLYINAWNEWGEGAYMEPDYMYGYAYLQATYEAIHGHEE